MDISVFAVGNRRGIYLVLNFMGVEGLEPPTLRV